MRRFIGFSASLVLMCAGLAAADSSQQPEPVASPSKLFEAGSYDLVTSQVQAKVESGEASLEDVFWAGQSLVRLDRRGEAVEAFRRLDSGDDETWVAIGRSAAALAENQRQAAIEQAVRATELGPDHFYANYQHGLVRMDAQQWALAAPAFERATQVDGNSAYAHYYAGMAYNRLKRLDRMLPHLTRFLELAPNAPERPAVQQVLKALGAMR
jgi:tetratricopeptide (TPR) repeat protein